VVRNSGRGIVEEMRGRRIGKSSEGWNALNALPLARAPKKGNGKSGKKKGEGQSCCV
jgi:hypothetical protein